MENSYFQYHQQLLDGITSQICYFLKVFLNIENTYRIFYKKFTYTKIFKYSIIIEFFCVEIL